MSTKRDLSGAEVFKKGVLGRCRGPGRFKNPTLGNSDIYVPIQ